MSHHNMFAIWAQLEKRADVTTILRDAVGQYAIQKACSSSESIQPFNRLVNIFRFAFHLQRIYLQPRQPSSTIKPFLIEPSSLIEILRFLLAVKDDCIKLRQDSSSDKEEILQSIGAVLLAGLRLLTLHKSKTVLPSDRDWESKAELLRSKLNDWPLGDSFQRILIGELCLSFLEELSTTAETRTTQALVTSNSKHLCEYHRNHSGADNDADLPQFNDGLVGFHRHRPSILHMKLTHGSIRLSLRSNT